MQEKELHRRLIEAIEHDGESADVDIRLSPEKRIIMLTGRVRSRCTQIGIEQTINRLAGGFTVVNQLKVDPHFSRPVFVLH